MSTDTRQVSYDPNYLLSVFSKQEGQRFVAHLCYRQRIKHVCLDGYQAQWDKNKCYVLLKLTVFYSSPKVIRYSTEKRPDFSRGVRETLKAWHLSIFLTCYVTALEKALVEIHVIYTNVVERNLQSSMLRRLLVKPRLTSSSCRILISKGLKTTATDETTSNVSRVSASGLFCLLVEHSIIDYI